MEHPGEKRRPQQCESHYPVSYTHLYPSRTRESVFSWEVVAGWTAQLIDKKEYFIQTDIPQLPTQAVSYTHLQQEQAKKKTAKERER